MKYFHFRDADEHRRESLRFNLGSPLYGTTTPVTIRVSGIARWFGDVFVERKRHQSTITERATHPRGIPVHDLITWKIESDKEFPDSLVVEQVSAGDVILRQSGGEHHIGPGGVYLLRIGEDHRYRTGPAGFAHKRFVELTGPNLPAILRTTGLINRTAIHPQDPHAVAGIMKRIHGLMRRTAPGWAEELAVAAYELVLQLRRDAFPSLPEPVRNTLHFIERNLHRAVANAELCAAAGLATTHLWRLFKQHLGVSPMKYLVNQRMSYARQLLSRHSLSVKEVAAAVGYDDQLYFSAQFKRHTGQSPSAFRLTTGRA